MLCFDVLNYADWMMCYLYMQAARDGREDLLDDLLEYFTEDQIDINALDKEGFAALHKAVMYHRVDIIKKLLAAKCGKLGTKYSASCNMYYAYIYMHPMLWNCGNKYIYL